MDMYSSIAPYYDRIFPRDPETIAFIEAALERECPVRDRLLDVGCGTGTVLSALRGGSSAVVGLDLDPELLALARVKLSCADGCLPETIELIEGDMGDLLRIFSPSRFSAVLCLGNTLPHLPDHEAVKAFFGNVRGALGSPGVFIFQTVNYDRILDGNIRSLPEIRTEGLSFVRNYSALVGDGRISFDTELTDFERGIVIRNSVPLLPLRADWMRDTLRSAGFRSVSLYGNFSGEPWRGSSFLTIGVCTT